MKDLLIKGGMVVSENAETVCDILCSNEKIKQIGNDICAPNADIIDACGKIVIPGGVDVHTHLTLDTGKHTVSDDFYSGTLAAACGGTTTIVDHPGFGPAGCSLDHQIKKYHELAKGRAVIDYGFHGVIQHVDNDVLSKMAELCKEGIASFKIYTTYAYKLCDKDILKILHRAKELNVLIAVHCEDDETVNSLRAVLKDEAKLLPKYHPVSRPCEAETEAVNRMICLAKEANDAPLYIVHLSCAPALETVKKARLCGQKNIYAETCPQYLFLDESLYDLPNSEGVKYIMCPPLRKGLDIDALWQGLALGILDTIGTDHCPFNYETQKSLGKEDFTKSPSGIPGIEERIPLMYSHGIYQKNLTLSKIAELCSTNPAKLFGLYPQKGVLKEGSDADIVIIDPQKKEVLAQKKLHSNIDYCAYEGIEVLGLPICTVSRGEVIVQDGVIRARAGRGRFIKRQR